VITEDVTTTGFDQSDFRKTLELQTPLGRIGQTEDIAPAAVFFASSDSKWIKLGEVTDSRWPVGIALHRNR